VSALYHDGNRTLQDRFEATPASCGSWTKGRSPSRTTTGDPARDPDATEV